MAKINTRIANQPNACSNFCDELGNVLTGDKSALILIKHILNKNPNSLVVTCLNSGTNTEMLTEKYDSKVIRTNVGSVEVSRKMLSTNALIGFEENGGFMFGKHNQVRDGCMSLGLMLDFLSTTDNSLSQEISQLPPSFTTKDKIECSKENANKIVKHFVLFAKFDRPFFNFFFVFQTTRQS